MNQEEEMKRLFELFNNNIFKISEILLLIDEIKKSEDLKKLPENHIFWKEYAKFLEIIFLKTSNKKDDFIKIRENLNEQLNTILEIKKHEENNTNNIIVNF